jgi:hypothetical protein
VRLYRHGPARVFGSLLVLPHVLLQHGLAQTGLASPLLPLVEEGVCAGLLSNQVSHQDLLVGVADALPPLILKDMQLVSFLLIM